MNNFATFLDLSAPDFLLLLITLGVVAGLVFVARALYKGFLKGYFGFGKKQ